MYVLLLWMRYLRTRYLAMVCVVSVMLGVATLIVVNGVMSGFSTKLKERLQELQSDIMIESVDPLVGFDMTSEEMIKRIKESPAGPRIKAISPSVDLFAIMRMTVYIGGKPTNWTQRARLVGVDAKLQADLGGWSEYLMEKQRSHAPSFDISPEAMQRYNMTHPPMRHDPLFQPRGAESPAKPDDQLQLQPIDPGRQSAKPLKDLRDLPPIDTPPSQPRKPRGIILGHALASYRDPTTKKDVYVLDRGDPVVIYTIGTALDPIVDEFIVCDYIKSELSDFDSNTIYVPLDYLQHLRTMEGRVNTIQIRLKNPSDPMESDIVKNQLESLFPTHSYHVATWKDKQKVLLAAIDIERGILNLLLFLIVGVAGFGILAIFSMIVREKTRDIGILKSLGASSGGVNRIFLGYGMLLGIVGAILGTGLGLLITDNINGIEHFLSRMTGAELFPRDVYYFKEIPTNIQLSSILAVNAGAVLVAVVFSILPAWRASRMHPVQALRYE